MSKPRKVPGFLQKTYTMISSDADEDTCIEWSAKGDTFVVADARLFAETVLPRYFRHNQYASFVRQLNMYGFRKIGPPERLEFMHKSFQRGQERMLHQIQRIAVRQTMAAEEEAAAGRGGGLSADNDGASEGSESSVSPRPKRKVRRGMHDSDVASASAFSPAASAPTQRGSRRFPPPSSIAAATAAATAAAEAEAEAASMRGHGRGAVVDVSHHDELMQRMTTLERVVLGLQTSFNNLQAHVSAMGIQTTAPPRLEVVAASNTPSSVTASSRPKKRAIQVAVPTSLVSTDSFSAGELPHLFSPRLTALNTPGVVSGGGSTTFEDQIRLASSYQPPTPFAAPYAAPPPSGMP